MLKLLENGHGDHSAGANAARVRAGGGLRTNRVQQALQSGCNTPADLIAYSKTEDGKVRDYLMLINFERGASAIPISQIEAANAKPGIESAQSDSLLFGARGSAQRRWAGMDMADTAKRKPILAVLAFNVAFLLARRGVDAGGGERDPP